MKNLFNAYLKFYWLLILALIVALAVIFIIQDNGICLSMDINNENYMLTPSEIERFILYCIIAALYILYVHRTSKLRRIASKSQQEGFNIGYSTAERDLIH